MKHIQKPKRPSLPTKLRRLLRREARLAEQKVSQALSDVPRITNETVAEHREEVLRGARKYIYPLQHSRHSIVRTSISLLVGVVILFLLFCGLALYKFQTTSGFMYDVTSVLPFPVAKVGPTYVTYSSYLFELRRNMHYYQTQQDVDFKTADGKSQLRHLRQQALAQVTQDAFVNQLAAAHGVTVSNQAVSNEIAIVKSQNRLGNSDQVLNEVLDKFWGWDESDFRRELKQQLLQQAVVAKLDTAAQSRAQTALKQVQGGANFATLAAQQSDDAATKTNGGQYANPITPNDGSISPIIVAQLQKLQPGQISGVFNTGYSLEIVKLLSNSNGSLTAAHIQFNLQPITTYTKPLQAKEPPKDYIKV